MAIMPTQAVNQMTEAASPAGTSAPVPHDAELVAMALANSANFDRLFDRYWESIFRFCCVRLNDWHLAEDAASQTFLNALRALLTFRAADPRTVPGVALRHRPQ